MSNSRHGTEVARKKSEVHLVQLRQCCYCLFVVPGKVGFLNATAMYFLHEAPKHESEMSAFVLSQRPSHMLAIHVHSLTEEAYFHMLHDVIHTIAFPTLSLHVRPLPCLREFPEKVLSTPKTLPVLIACTTSVSLSQIQDRPPRAEPAHWHARSFRHQAISLEVSLYLRMMRDTTAVADQEGTPLASVCCTGSQLTEMTLHPREQLLIACYSRIASCQYASALPTPEKDRVVGNPLLHV